LVQCQTRNRNISEHRISPSPRKVTADLVQGSRRVEKVTDESGREDRENKKYRKERRNTTNRDESETTKKSDSRKNTRQQQKRWERRELSYLFLSSNAGDVDAVVLVITADKDRDYEAQCLTCHKFSVMTNLMKHDFIATNFEAGSIDFRSGDNTISNRYAREFPRPVSFSGVAESLKAIPCNRPWRPIGL
jgi:hypothetical protein